MGILASFGGARAGLSSGAALGPCNVTGNGLRFSYHGIVGPSQPGLCLSVFRTVCPSKAQRCIFFFFIINSKLNSNIDHVTAYLSRITIPLEFGRYIY